MPYLNPQRSRKRRLALGFLALSLILGSGIFIGRTFLGGTKTESKKTTAESATRQSDTGNIIRLNSDETFTAKGALSNTYSTGLYTEGDGTIEASLVPSLLLFYSRLSLSNGQNLTKILTESIDPALSPEDRAAETISALDRHWTLIEKTLPKFSEADISDSAISIGEKSAPEDIKNYFNAVAAVYEDFAPVLIDSEKRILEASLKKGSPPAELAQVRNAIKQMQKEILRITVPKKAAVLHKKELWGLENHILQLALLERVSPAVDPLYFMLLMRIRELLQDAMASFHAETVPAWLAEEGVIISSNDKASIIYAVNSR